MWYVKGKFAGLLIVASLFFFASGNPLESIIGVLAIIAALGLLLR